MESLTPLKAELPGKTARPFRSTPMFPLPVPGGDLIITEHTSVDDRLSR